MQIIYLKEMNDFKKNPSSEVGSQDQYYNKMKSINFSHYENMPPNLNFMK